MGLLTACGLFSPFLVRCLAPRRKPVSYVPLLPIFVAIAWVWRHAASLVGLPRVLSALSTCFPIYARTPGAKLCLAFLALQCCCVYAHIHAKRYGSNFRSRPCL